MTTTNTTRQPRNPEPERGGGPLKATDPVYALPVQLWLSADLKREVESFNRRRMEVLTLRASALDAIDDTLDAVQAGKFNHKHITAADKARADLLVADAQELHLCGERIRLYRLYEPANRAIREGIREKIEERESEIQAEGLKNEEDELVIDARIRTDKAITALFESMPPEVDMHGVHQFSNATTERRELLEAGLKKHFSL